jgi:chaperonin GroES
MSFRPLHDRVLVRRLESEDKTSGGIIIPDSAKEKPQEGKVIAAGAGARDESGKLVPLDVSVGDVVLFAKWSGTEVKINGEDLLIMKESDILGIVTPPAKAAAAPAPKLAAVKAPKAEKPAKAPKAAKPVKPAKAPSAPKPAKAVKAPKAAAKPVAAAPAPAKRGPGRPKKTA